MTTRRRALQAALTPAVSLRIHAAPAAKWTAEWDRALIEAALPQQDALFDPSESMLTRKVGPDYNYHSQIRNQVAHPTVPSFQYALLLLEAGGTERVARAARIIERVLSLQDVDPSSKWYGIWGYYLEEPPPKMSPADWNWADFNGATMLLIAHRHAAKLPPALLPKLHEGIRHAARSVQRRNVTMTYTNIAIQGSFVTLGAAQLLDDAELRDYATDRLRRFAATVDQSGSFNEYNSPTYANVSIVNLTRIRMVLRDPDVLALTEKIHARAWLHLGKHWHAPTRQLAGPMSRCYSTDIGSPLWIQKALGGRLDFASFDELKSAPGGAAGETAIHDYRCPESLVPLFLSSGPARQHREVFVGASSIPPVHGTTWLHPDFCLGSANRSDFWIQRRPLLAYWGDGARPARFVQLRFLKDDYDFSSALLYSVQEKNCVLGVVNFRSPGGDKHISLDPIPNGEFQASRFRLCLDIAGLGEGAAQLADESRIAVDLGGARLWVHFREALFGEGKPRLSTAREGNRLVISLDLIPPGQQRLIRLRELPAAYVAFTLAMEGGRGSLEVFDRGCRAAAFRKEAARFEWDSPAGLLALTAGTSVKTAAEQDRAFSESLNGSPVPLVRLSDEKLV